MRVRVGGWEKRARALWSKGRRQEASRPLAVIQSHVRGEHSVCVCVYMISPERIQLARLAEVSVATHIGRNPTQSVAPRMSKPSRLTEAIPDSVEHSPNTGRSHPNCGPVDHACLRTGGWRLVVVMANRGRGVALLHSARPTGSMRHTHMGRGRLVTDSDKFGFTERCARSKLSAEKSFANFVCFGQDTCCELRAAHGGWRSARDPSHPGARASARHVRVKRCYPHIREQVKAMLDHIASSRRCRALAVH